MSEKKKIAVVGATGAQGNGLVEAVLNDPAAGFSVRALTRDAASPKAAALKAKGAEVVAADVDDEESLKRAFDGCDGAYCVTFFWDHLDPEREKASAKKMANAAKAVGVGHVVWSTLEDTRKRVPLDDDRMPRLMGKYKVPHFDAKGESDAFFEEAGVPTTYMLTSFYWDNFIHFGMHPQPGPDGVLAITLPMGDKRLPGIAAADIGACAYGLFRGGSEWPGKRVGISGGHLTGGQMAESRSRLLGKEVRYNAVEPDVYRSFGFPGADDLGNMFQYKRDFEEEYCAARDLETSRRLNPGLLSFDAWLEKHKADFPVS